MAIKLRNSSREEKSDGILGRESFLAFLIIGFSSPQALMAFYPWLSSEMAEGKRVFTAKEWEQLTGSSGSEAEYDYETESYDSVVISDYD